MKTNDMDVMNMMPGFQIINGWFGVYMFLCLGVWSKRFRIGVNNKAEEEKAKRRNSKYTEEVIVESPRTTETSPMTSRPTSPEHEDEGEQSSRPGSSTSQPPGSRPASS